MFALNIFKEVIVMLNIGSGKTRDLRTLSSKKASRKHQNILYSAACLNSGPGEIGGRRPLQTYFQEGTSEGIEKTSKTNSIRIFRAVG